MYFFNYGAVYKLRSYYYNYYSDIFGIISQFDDTIEWPFLHEEERVPRCDLDFRTIAHNGRFGQFDLQAISTIDATYLYIYQVYTVDKFFRYIKVATS